MADLEETLKSVGHSCTASDARTLMSDLGNKGTIGMNSFQLLFDGYKGAPTFLEALSFCHEVQISFNGIEKSIAHVCAGSDAVDIALFSERLASKARFDMVQLVSIFKFLSLRCFEDVLSKHEMQRLSLLRGISSFLHLGLWRIALVDAFGSFEKAFKKTDDNQSGAISWDEFQSMTTILNRKGMMPLHNDELRAVWLLLDKSNDGSISFGELLNIEKFPSGEDVIEDVCELALAVERHFESDQPIDDAFWTPLRTDKDVDVRQIGDPSAHLMSFACFKQALNQYGFAPKALPVRAFFDLIFDRTRCGHLSFQDWQLLDFPKAQRDRAVTEKFQGFVTQEYKDPEAMMENMLQHQAIAARSRRRRECAERTK
jgi:hypothetical protein